MEEDHNWIDKTIKEINPTKGSRGVSYSSMHTVKSTQKGRYGLRDYVAVKGILPCVRCVDIVEDDIERSCADVHSFVVELTSLAIIPFHFLKPIIIFLIPSTVFHHYVYPCFGMNRE